MVVILIVEEVVDMARRFEGLKKVAADEYC